MTQFYFALCKDCSSTEQKIENTNYFNSLPEVYTDEMGIIRVERLRVHNCYQCKKNWVFSGKKVEAPEKTCKVCNVKVPENSCSYMRVALYKEEELLLNGSYYCEDHKPKKD